MNLNLVIGVFMLVGGVSGIGGSFWSGLNIGLGVVNIMLGFARTSRGL